MIHSMTLCKDSHNPELKNVADVASPTPYSATHRVLSTTELLCNIAAHLPLKDMLTAAAVCRDWRGALAADPTIQQALFLKPRKICEVIANNHHILNLERQIPIQECTIIGELNPWVSGICGPINLRYSTYPSVNLHFLHRGGLWREMFVSQPPCKAIAVSIHSFALRGHTQDVELQQEAGIRMGELFDFVHEQMRYYPECRGSVSHVKKFSTEEYARDAPYATTRCEVRNGEVCRPAELTTRPYYSGFDCFEDYESDDRHDG